MPGICKLVGRKIGELVLEDEQREDHWEVPDNDLEFCDSFLNASNHQTYKFYLV